MTIKIVLALFGAIVIKLHNSKKPFTLYSLVVTVCTASLTQQFCVLPTQCIYVFCVDLRTNSDYFPIQH